MKIHFAAILILIFCTGAFGQTLKKKADDTVKSDFTGTWVLDRTKTKKVEYDLTLIVAQNEPEMKVTKIYNFRGAKKTDEQTYYTDGRRVPDKTNDSEIISVETVWSNGALIHKYQVSKIKEKTVEFTSTEKWEFSKDGKTLTLIITETVPATAPTQTGGNTQTQGLLNSADTVKVLKFQRSEANMQ